MPLVAKVFLKLKVKHIWKILLIYYWILPPQIKDKVYSYYPNLYIYEEYIEGEEFSVEGVVQNKEVFIAGITDKRVTPKFSLEYIAFFPSDKPEKVKDEIKKKTKLAIQSLKLITVHFI